MKQAIHEGKNLRRLREMLGWKQEALALELGWSQRKVSQMENRARLNPVALEQIAGVWKINPDIIRHFDEQQAWNLLRKAVVKPEAAVLAAEMVTHQCLHKLVELYEALLLSEREKNYLMQRLLKAGRVIMYGAAVGTSCWSDDEAGYRKDFLLPSRQHEPNLYIH